ncbi:PucR family transcriptional regulator ligand-binding domain-containing protein [Alkalihalobacillus sp. MEB130]|uniref:PucR family transcriptional regulator n=1 Tax=Alkalihalobacillus sp. MEB130 TaxID=2976704 RepID=UPI0028DE4A77|nr:PucR family transcriptional regulator ligand-binding domain-containing protein [Alkalihalobacillus sp. MEB130]MDT8860689.1 PucR family transcriptional regulator ligand-binding domain-containing protein [Alkalihalobacillus sp. MEB130]
MNFESKLSIDEILKSKHFSDANVIAGKGGLSHPVRWVHVLEVTSIDNLLNGNELILSTGVGWKGDPTTFALLVQKFIDSNAAGLCIELGPYVQEVPQEIIDLANNCDFPLITFAKEVRFIDITQEIHSLLVKKHYQLLSDLEDFSNRLNQLLLSSNPKPRILELLYEYLGMRIFYISNQGEVTVIPKTNVSDQDKLFDLIKTNNIPKNMNVAHQPVQALNQTFADLFIISETEAITEFESLILDRSAIALAQALLRELYIEEQKKAKEAEWVSHWLEGDHSKEQIQTHLFELEPDLKPNGCAVLLCKASNLDKINSEITYLKVFLSSIFEQRGIFLCSSIQKNQMAMILVNKRKKHDFKRRVQDCIDCIKKSDFIKKQNLTKMEISVGQFVDQLDHVRNSYRTAKETLSIKEKMPNEIRKYFYEDLYIFRIVLAANEQGILREFIYDYIGPVLEHDQQNNGELLQTLKMYLRCKGAKKETAEHLFIVRQTLYHRLDKLYELIGNDFMEPYKRQAIEVSISAYEYAVASKQIFDASYFSISKTS